MKTQVLRSLNDIIDRFDVFLLDQFGVLHNGKIAYADAIAAAHYLRQHNKSLVVISNSGKRAADNAARLQALGFDASLFERVVTSGEVAWQQLHALNAGTRVLLFCNPGGTSPIAGLQLARTDSPADADIILMAGLEVESAANDERGVSRSPSTRISSNAAIDDYLDFLQPALARSVPMVCSNPDKLMLMGNGSATRFSTGAIAAAYAAAGGQVTMIGKPYPAIYQAALSGLEHLSSARANTIGMASYDRVVCVGDSIEHDIAGGRAAGVASLLIRGGIHATADDAELQRLYTVEGAEPDYILDYFFAGSVA